MDELFIKFILSNLPLIDLIKCRLICKNIKFTIDNKIKIKYLIISLNQIPYNRQWFHSNNQLDLTNLIKVKNLNILQIDLLKNCLFSELKHLYIIDYPPNHRTFDLNELNNYSSIEYLELWFLKLKLNSKLNLPNLKSFCVNEQSFSKIIIDTIIKQFKTLNKINLFDYNQFESIKEIHCTEYSSEIIKFTNLEYLNCRVIKFLDRNFLICLNKLKKIQFFNHDQVYYCLKEERDLLMKYDLEIYYLGINIDKQTDNDDNLVNKFIKSTNSNRYELNDLNLEMYIKYFARLDNKVTSITNLNYNSLENNYHKIDRLENFIQKFPNILYVHVNENINNDYFNLILNNLKSLNKLKLIDTNLNQDNLIKLSSVCQSLNTLIIKQNLKYFDFIFNLSNLINLSIENIPLNLIKSLFNKLKYLDNIDFEYNEHKMICISKTGNKFNLEYSNISITKHCLDDAIDSIRNNDYDSF